MINKELNSNPTIIDERVNKITITIFFTNVNKTYV